MSSLRPLRLLSAVGIACALAAPGLALGGATSASSAKPPATGAASGGAASSKPTGKPAAAASSAASGSKATGKLNREEFEEALKPYLKDMHDCYDKTLKKDALVEGEVVLKLDVQGGKVASADTDRDASTLKGDELHKCIVAVAKKMKMPLAKNDAGEHDAKALASIRYPLDFSLGIDVEAGASKIEGAKLEYPKVKNVFFMERLSIGRCYLDAYKAKKGVAATGKLIVKITTAGGVVSAADQVAADTTVADGDLIKCVLDAVKTFKFPVAKDAKGNDDPKAVSYVTYPLEFRAQ